MMLNLKDKRVIVTGASSDIGCEIARGFMLEGARVVAHSHTNICPILDLQKEAKYYQVDYHASPMAPIPTEPISIVADLTNQEERKSFIYNAIEELGGLDILVNNAGDIFGPTNFLDLTVESWRKTIALDLEAPFFLSREAFKHMRVHGGGKIINISSIAAKYGASETTMHYGAAKAGLESLTRGMARFGAPHKILVNTIQLGVVDTKMHAKLGRDITERVKTIPLKRAAKPEEVANLCLFIASKHGDYMTGQIYPLTGGD